MEKKGFKWGYLAIGLCLILVGISFIAFSYALTALAIAIGISLTLYGIIYGVTILSDTDRSMKFALRIIIAGVALVGGVVTLILRESAVGIITDIIALLLIVDGSFKLKCAIDVKRIGGIYWWIMLSLSVVTIVPSFAVSKMLGVSPDEPILSIIIGIIIIVDGVANLLLPFLPSDDENNRRLRERDSSSVEKSAGTDSKPDRENKPEISPER